MQANSIGELFEIREHNRPLLDSLGTLGTALGKKNRTGDPAILVFVPQKIGEPWLRRDQVVPPQLTGPRGLTCPTDVIAGESSRDLQLRVFDRWAADLGLRPWGELVATDALSIHQLELRDRLTGRTDVLTPGCQLGFTDEDGKELRGALACFAQHRTTKRRGFLTNQHIGKLPGIPIYFPHTGSRPVGLFGTGALTEPVKRRYGTEPHFNADPWQSRLRVDAGFCELHPEVDWASEVDVRLPVIDNSSIRPQALGAPKPLDLDSMGSVGTEVLGVGPTRSYQMGRVAAAAFEFLSPADGWREYHDYLIVGDGDQEFSDPGDSGKLIVTAEGFHPIAIMWGGEWARRRHGRELENWTHATDIGYIMNKLEVDLILA